MSVCDGGITSTVCVCVGRLTSVFPWLVVYIQYACGITVSVCDGGITSTVCVGGSLAFLDISISLASGLYTVRLWNHCVCV